ncbi:hypothetical protein [Moheibacter sp.]|uniref:hypothetical protein n=1 Tax=Moheibacter sp. TaxID=1965316 RepID=UPI003C709C84
MNKDVPNNNNSNDEVDLIRLLDYFKGGIKSIFRKLWQLIEVFLKFIVLIKKNWLIVLGITAVGAIYGWYLDNFSTSENLTYEMIVRSNPISNIELYAFSSEVDNQKAINYKSEGIDMIKRLNVKTMSVTPLEREEDVINSYFDKIESAVMRNDMTDTLYYHSFEIDGHKGKMENTDYSLQAIKLKAPENTSPDFLQKELLNYLNNLPGVEAEVQNKLSILKTYEKVLKQNLDNIDSVMASRASLNKNSGLAGAEQLLVNTASRGNVEADLLKYSEALSKKLYGTQKKITEYESGISVVSNLRHVKEKGVMDNKFIRYAILAFGLSLLIILLIEFNKYLNKYQKA